MFIASKTLQTSLQQHVFLVSLVDFHGRLADWIGQQSSHSERLHWLSSAVAAFVGFQAIRSPVQSFAATGHQNCFYFLLVTWLSTGSPYP